MKKLLLSVLLFFIYSFTLFAEDNPIADPGAIVISGDMRFTVLTPEIIRIEWSDKQMFEDRASFTVLNRRFPVPAFTKEEKDGFLYIKTEKLTLQYRIGSFPGTFNPASSKNLKITFDVDGRTETWYPWKEDPLNLKGTTRTLDGSNGYNKKAEMEKGLISRSGWALIDETDTRHDGSISLMFEPRANGVDWVSERADKPAMDWYFIAYGNDYKKALSDFTKMSGKIPMPPMYAFGYWYSKYEEYSDEDFKNLVREMQSRDIPLDVMVVDMDWHYSGSEKDNGRGGWTGWSWNKRLFPDPPQFIKWLHDNNLKTTLNLHPADGIAPDEDNFTALAQELNLPTDKTIEWNIENEDFYKSFFKHILNPHEDIGVDFWWLDWQQWPLAKNVDKLGNTFWLNHVFYNDMQLKKKGRPMIFHRWGGLGNHRYQIGFSGDAHANFPTLAFQPYFTATASNVGYGYWSHDIGGHHQDGDNNPELFLRWIQYGIFSPIIRTHSTNAAHIERRIWKYPNFPLMKEALELRYAMVPYIYTYARHAYDTGISLCRPLYYDSPDNDEAYREEKAYMFGNEILASPVVEPSNSKIGTVTKKLWIPEGQWFEAQTGSVLKGDQKHLRSFAQNGIPFYYKEGAVIPMYPNVKHLKVRPDTLIVQFIPGESGEFNYYEDEGDNEKYKEDKYTITKIQQKTNAQQGVYTIYPREGSFDNMPSTRKYELRLLSKLPAKKVIVDGKEYPYSAQPKAECWSYDSKSLSIILNTPAKNCNDKIEAIVTYDDNQSVSESLIASKMGQMARLIQCSDSLNSRMGSKYPDLFVKMVKTRDRIAADPQNTLAELKDFQESLEVSINKLLEVDGAPKDEIKEWKNFILLDQNISETNPEDSEINKVPGYNVDGSKLWIVGSAVPGNVAVLTEDPTQIAGYFRYHGKLLSGEFRIMNTPQIQSDTKFYVPGNEDVQSVVGSGDMSNVNVENAQGWTVTIPNDYYKIKIDAINNKISGEIFVAREDLLLVGGATESGWNAGSAVRFNKDLNNPNLFIFSGILKEAASGVEKDVFKILGQSDWGPVSFHPNVPNKELLKSKYICENFPGDHKWKIDLSKQGSYVIKVDLFEETITAEHTNLIALYVNGKEWENLNDIYTLDCNTSDAPLKIEVVAQPGAVVSTGTVVEFTPSKAGLNTFDFVITSPNGGDKMSYQLKVLKPFTFNDLVTQKWNNTLTVNNNPQKNGGYNFVGYEWYEDGRIVGTKQYYSAGKSSTDFLKKDATYMVKLKDDKNNYYQTCPTKLTLEPSKQIFIYPNPVKAGESVKIETGINTTKSGGNINLRICDFNGNVVRNEKLPESNTSFRIATPGIYVIQLTSGDEVYTAKLLVK